MVRCYTSISDGVIRHNIYFFQFKNVSIALVLFGSAIPPPVSQFPPCITISLLYHNFSGMPIIWRKCIVPIEANTPNLNLFCSLTKNCTENIPRIGKLPYGTKRGFIERKALLIQENQRTRFGQNSKIWSKSWNLV